MEKLIKIINDYFIEQEKLITEQLEISHQIQNKLVAQLDSSNIYNSEKEKIIKHINRNQDMQNRFILQLNNIDRYNYEILEQIKLIKN